MSDQPCPDRVRLVEELGEAMNEKKRVEKDESHSADDMVQADENLRDALEAVRVHKAEGGCASKEPARDKSSAA